MVAMDFDLTLLEWRNEAPYVPADTIKLLNRLIESGVEVGIVSGRYSWTMRLMLGEAGVAWGEPFPTFIVPRETFVYSVAGDQLIPDEEWNEQRADELVELLRWIMLRQADWHREMGRAGLDIAHWILWGDYGLEAGFRTMEEADWAREMLAAWTADMPLAHAHRNHKLAHLVLATAGKGKSLLRVATGKGIAPDEVLAIGDSLNDLSMLDGKLGFHVATVANGDEPIQEAVRAAGGMVATQRVGAGVTEIVRDYQGKGLLPH